MQPDSIVSFLGASLTVCRLNSCVMTWFSTCNTHVRIFFFLPLHCHYVDISPWSFNKMMAATLPRINCCAIPPTLHTLQSNSSQQLDALLIVACADVFAPLHLSQRGFKWLKPAQNKFLPDVISRLFYKLISADLHHFRFRWSLAACLKFVKLLRA